MVQHCGCRELAINITHCDFLCKYSMMNCAAMISTSQASWEEAGFNWMFVKLAILINRIPKPMEIMSCKYLIMNTMAAVRH